MAPRKLGWTFFGLCSVVLVGYAFHRGVLVGKHVGYTLDDPPYECTDIACSVFPGYKLYCIYWASSGTFRDSGGSAYPRYDEAQQHGDCDLRSRSGCQAHRAVQQAHRGLPAEGRRACLRCSDAGPARAWALGSAGNKFPNVRHDANKLGLKGDADDEKNHMIQKTSFSVSSNSVYPYRISSVHC